MGEGGDWNGEEGAGEGRIWITILRFIQARRVCCYGPQLSSAHWINDYRTWEFYKGRSHFIQPSLLAHR